MQERPQFIDVFNYYKGLIQLRKEHVQFRQRTAADIKAKISFLPSPRKGVMFTINDANDPWKEIVVIYNGEIKEQQFSLPDGTWNVVVDQANAGTTPMYQVSGNDKRKGNFRYGDVQGKVVRKNQQRVTFKQSSRVLKYLTTCGIISPRKGVRICLEKFLWLKTNRI